MSEKNNSPEYTQKDHTPVQPKNSFRVILDLNTSGQRLDAILLKTLRDQSENSDLKNFEIRLLRFLKLNKSNVLNN